LQATLQQAERSMGEHAASAPLASPRRQSDRRSSDSDDDAAMLEARLEEQAHYVRTLEGQLEKLEKEVEAARLALAATPMDWKRRALSERDAHAETRQVRSMRCELLRPLCHGLTVTCSVWCMRASCHRRFQLDDHDQATSNAESLFAEAC
jgi:septal ring factor EnvC (AmiA/AmiB activator)